MTRRYLMVFAFVLISSISLPALSQTHPHNGLWWKELERIEKRAYVIGFADGSAEADGMWAYLQRQSKLKLPSTRVSSARGSNDYSNVSYGQLVDGLDEFYKDYKNTQIHSFKAILVIKEQIKGMDAKTADDYISFLRKEASDPNYDK